jgi:NADH-quinone oxidoreductase subunit M
MILSAVYMLWMYQRVILGEVRNSSNMGLKDLNLREKLVLAPIVALVIAMGIYPSPFLSRSDQAIQSIRLRVTPVALGAQASLPDSSGAANSHNTTEQAGMPALPGPVVEKR